MRNDQKTSWSRCASVILVALILTSFNAAGSAAKAEPRPNIVLFMADDLGWADVTWHGSRDAMPHLDRLAAGGVRLEAHYVHPMCSPTRAALMTGRYASRFGVTAAQNQQALPFGTQTIASLLKAGGYDTAITGKWHLGSRGEWGPNQFGFDFGYGSLAGGVGPWDHLYKRGEFSRTWHRDGELVDEKGHVTDLIAREAVAWVESRTDRPFFLYVPFTAIHVPIDEPQKWHDQNAHLSDDAKRLRAACSTHMDHTIGAVLSAVQRTGKADNTFVLFISDNGAHAPSDNQGGPYPGEYVRLKVGNDNLPLRGHKTQVYEGGVRTPGVAFWPGRLQPRDEHTPLHAVDWLPTLCALGGVDVPSSLKADGTNIWPVLKDRVTLPSRTLYSAAPQFRARMIRHGDWKLVVTEPRGNNGDGSRRLELFHLADDIAESRNLAESHPAELARMQALLDDVSARDNDAVVPQN